MDGPIGLVDVGPYRATRLWLDLVQMFVTGMPLKRHWRNFKVVENCFTGREAVKWFHGALLQSTKASKLDCFTRSQTITLLDKFFHSGVFTSVSGNYVTKFRVSSMDLYRLSPEAMNGGTIHLPFGQNIHNLPHQQNHTEESKENQISRSNKQNVHPFAATNTEVNRNYPQTVWPPPHPHHKRGNEHTERNNTTTRPSVLPIIKGAKPKVLGVLSPRNPPNLLRGRQRDAAHWSSESSNGNYRSSSAGPIPTRDRHDCRETGIKQMQSKPRWNAQSMDHIDVPLHPLPIRMCEPGTRTNVAMHISLGSHTTKDNDTGVVLRQRSPQADTQRAGHSRNTIGSFHSHKRATSYDLQSFKNIGNAPNVFKELNTSHKNYQDFSPMPRPLSEQITALSESTRNIANSAVSLLPSPSFRGSSDLLEPKNIDEECQDIAWRNAFRSRILTLFPGSLLASLLPTSMPASWLQPGDEIRGNFVTLLETLFDVQRQGNNTCPDELSEKLCKSVIAHFTALSQFYSFNSDIYHLLHQGFIILQHLDEKTYQLKCHSPDVVNSKRSSVARVTNDLASRQSNDIDLPPNACFETEFLSASPVTRIIAITSLRRNTTKKNLFDFEEETNRKSIAPSLRRRNSHRSSMKQISSTEVNILRNTSGGYINPALDTDIDVIPDLDYVAAMSCLQKLMECSRQRDAKKIDMALLSQCRRWDSGETEEKDVIFESKDISGEGLSEPENRWEKHDYVNVGFRSSETETESGSDGYDGGNSGSESEGASFHTAVCTSSMNATRLSISVDDAWLGHVDATAVEFMRLVFLCVEPQRRNHLKQLLLALKVVSPSTKSLAKIVDALALTLTTNSLGDVDEDLMKRLLNFMVAHQSVLFDIPQGLLEQIEHSANFLKRQQAPSTISLPFVPSIQTLQSKGSKNAPQSNASLVTGIRARLPTTELGAISAQRQFVKASTISLPARLSRNNSEGQVAYCTQVSTEEFEQQKLTVSQMAIAELLEQLLSDCKMSVKEKKKRLKTFKDSYPHIYYRRFPIAERTEKKRLLQPVFTKFKSMRI